MQTPKDPKAPMGVHIGGDLFITVQNGKVQITNCDDL